jgi:uncharacterized protein YlxW (UPF0749 family)
MEEVEELILPDPDYVKDTDYETVTTLDLQGLVRHLKSLNEIITSQNERIKALEDALKSEQKIREAAIDMVRNTNKLAIAGGAWPFPSQRKT